MPMYQFACRDCGSDFEKRLRMSQAGTTQVCPTCGSQETRKRISAIALSGTARASRTSVVPPPASPFS